MERGLENNKDKGESGYIVFRCSLGDWENTTILSPGFKPGSQEDILLSNNVEALFARHNIEEHAAAGRLEVKYSKKPIPPKKS